MAGVNAEAPTASDAAASAITVLLNMMAPPLSSMPLDEGGRTERGTANSQANACPISCVSRLVVAVLVCRKRFCRSAKCHKDIEQGVAEADALSMKKKKPRGEGTGLLQISMHGLGSERG